MNIKCSTKTLQSAVQKAQYSALTTTSMPILTHLLLEAKDGKLYISSTDMDTSIKITADVEVVEEGITTVGAKVFFTVLQRIKTDEVVLETKTKGADNLVFTQLKAGKKIECKFPSFDAQTFPEFPKMETEYTVELSGKELKTVIKQLVHAGANDENNYALNGICFDFIEKELYLVATDKRRMAMNTIGLKDDVNAQLIISKRHIQIIQQFLTDGDVEVLFSDNLIKFIVNENVLVTRLVDATYAKYNMATALFSLTDADKEQIKGLLDEVPKTKEAVLTESIKAVEEKIENADAEEKGSLSVFLNKLNTLQSTVNIDLDTKKLVDAITLVSSVAEKKEQQPMITFNLKENCLTLTSFSKDVGEIKDEIEVEYSGREITNKVVAEYVVDMSKNLLANKIQMTFIDDAKPIKITSDDGLFYVLMPQRNG